MQYFYECPKCRTLFYRAIPYAFTHFGVTACPNCKRAFPNGEDIKYPDTSKTNQTVFTNYGLRYSLEELEPLYEKLVAKQPKLSKVIANIMLVKTAKGNDIWVVCQGSDYNVETDLRSLLWAYSDKKLPFSSQATLEGVKKTDGLSIVKQMKGS